jgi:hypothetical protein
MHRTHRRGLIVSCPVQEHPARTLYDGEGSNSQYRVFKLATNLLVAIMESNKPFDKEKTHEK